MYMRQGDYRKLGPRRYDKQKVNATIIIAANGALLLKPSAIVLAPRLGTPLGAALPALI